MRPSELTSNAGFRIGICDGGAAGGVGVPGVPGVEFVNGFGELVKGLGPAFASWGGRGEIGDGFWVQLKVEVCSGMEGCGTIGWKGLGGKLATALPGNVVEAASLWVFRK